jgi:hypothetical protein
MVVRDVELARGPDDDGHGMRFQEGLSILGPQCLETPALDLDLEQADGQLGGT